ncbi:MAG: hypothetical protein GH150_00945 [Hadesarchaea archaeon]|nr:hypothetical protein [Hadesarchaea archaeon]
MADVLTPKQRSYNMAQIRASNTKPELKIRQVMMALGFTYHPKGIYGNPDFANRKHKMAIFIDGCVWHGCRLCY